MCVKNSEFNFYAKKELLHHPAHQSTEHPDCPDCNGSRYYGSGCLVDVSRSIVIIVTVVPLVLIVIRSHRMIQACIRIPACLFVSHFLTPITLLTVVSTLAHLTAVAVQGVSFCEGERTWRSCSQSLLPCYPRNRPCRYYTLSGSPSNGLGRSFLRLPCSPTGARISLPAHPQTSLLRIHDEP